MYVSSTVGIVGCVMQAEAEKFIAGEFTSLKALERDVLAREAQLKRGIVTYETMAQLAEARAQEARRMDKEARAKVRRS